MKTLKLVLIAVFLPTVAIAEPPAVEEIPEEKKDDTAKAGETITPVEEAKTPPPAIEEPKAEELPPVTEVPEELSVMQPDHGVFIVNSDSWTAQLYGYVLTMGRWTQNDSGNPFVGRTDGFQLQNARLGLQAEYKEKVAVVVSLEAAEDQRSGADDLQGTLGPAVRDAFVDYKIRPTLRLRAGHFKPIFDGEENTALSLIHI